MLVPKTAVAQRVGMVQSASVALPNANCAIGETVCRPSMCEHRLSIAQFGVMTTIC